jgi:hypothetical protein
MGDWRKSLHFDPLPPLLLSENKAIQYFAQRDLMDQPVNSIHSLWQLPEAQRILKKQYADGSWLKAAEVKHPAINYRLIETWRQFRYLVEQYGFTSEHPQAQKAAEFLFSCQAQAGDFRGFLANQYATYYTGAIMTLLIEAGYADDPRIEKGFQWLLAMRQDDLGWTIPLLTHKLDRAALYRLTSEFAPPLEPVRSQPYSHNWTGMVLRAFAAHPRYRASQAAVTAAQLLTARFFQPDSYSSYQAASYWVRFDYPFWWNNLVSALDSISLIGLPGHDEPIRQALQWFVDHQEQSGLWKVSYARPNEQEKETPQAQEKKLWVSLAISRVFKRLSVIQLQD